MNYDPFRRTPPRLTREQIIENEINKKKEELQRTNFSSSPSNDIQFISSESKTPTKSPSFVSETHKPRTRPLFSEKYSSSKNNDSSEEEIIIKIENTKDKKTRKANYVYNQIVYCPSLKQHIVYCGINTEGKCVCTGFNKVTAYELDMDQIQPSPEKFIPKLYDDLNQAIKNRPVTESEFIKLCKEK
ncbi:hypothetical protein TVAG_181760 [Trichomonas vaginalis G3]|uniref:Uncharacterized protein n=1 Tax=Trichomonas vaginalis (strain ATCC PRA-98 / G3) TaxID=412133 RepID=A2GAI6_TRIV3|nr:hypothetical protein TVAGG3_0570550 [Trichomonas vaginalis G3]EAX85834.1 hypothetical protein TVAG_181760 [Trichomonas vaginalis G3]KAI5521874.1 hypothetical protein TVAGG3_0570550 [Trichomonas vaginalis G3]|eukprot:XP_001298764.1 hypothetical protein [Trichomonas vaginalis G3]